jgi:hypothetical protein
MLDALSSARSLAFRAIKKSLLERLPANRSE